MRDRFTLPFDAVAPPAEDLFTLLGMRGAGRYGAAASRALEELAALARPGGLAEDMEGEDLGAILADGGCHPEALLGRVLPESERLALYAVTLGPGVEDRAAALFAAGEELAGLLLDAAASCAADRASRAVVERTLERWGREGCVKPGTAASGFSPGYCGWPVEGQRALFARLRPQEAGIVLGPSGLMKPLKSVSGVIAAGRPGAFDASRGHPFCDGCRHPECEERRRSMPVWTS